MSVRIATIKLVKVLTYASLNAREAVASSDRVNNARELPFRTSKGHLGCPSGEASKRSHAALLFLRACVYRVVFTGMKRMMML